MNASRQPTGPLYGLTSHALNTILRTELCELGTLRCCGRTDKLCIGGILGGGLECYGRQTSCNRRNNVWDVGGAGYSGSESDSLYARTNPTATVLLPTQLFRVRRDHTIRST